MAYKLSIFTAQDASDTKYAAATREVLFQQLMDIVTKTSWAPGTFKPDAEGKLHRSNDNLESMNLLVFDIDDGMTIEQAHSTM